MLVHKAELFSNLPFLGLAHHISTLGVQRPLMGFMLCRLCCGSSFSFGVLLLRVRATPPAVSQNGRFPEAEGFRPSPPMPETEAVLVPKAELFSNLPFLGMTHQTSTLGVQGPLIGFILW